MKRLDGRRGLSLLLAFLLLLSAAGCGGADPSPSSAASMEAAGPGDTAEAASMWLVKTEGTVAVTDGDGANVSLLDRLGLFSGYDVETQPASYGWIDLDDTKLTKMDENSGVEVQKNGKRLTLTVYRGSLFFRVTEPLADDESMEIRCSTMVTAIRGTCGWVSVPDPGHMYVYILEGTVECSVGDETEPVSAGQTAAIDAGESTVTVESYSVRDVPSFVLDEVEGDETLAAAILDASGLDLLNGGSGGEEGEGEGDGAGGEEEGEDGSRTALEEMGYIGDPAASTITADQARTLGESLWLLVTDTEEMYKDGVAPVSSGELQCYASLFDAGNGSPGIVFLNTGDLPLSFQMGGAYPDCSGIVVMYFRDGQLTRVPNAMLNVVAFTDHYVVFNGYMNPDGTDSQLRQEFVYDLAADGLYGDIVSGLTYDEYGPGGIVIDGSPVTQEEEYEAWQRQWLGSETEPVISFGLGSGGFGMIQGAQDAGKLASALLDLAENIPS